MGGERKEDFWESHLGQARAGSRLILLEVSQTPGWAPHSSLWPAHWHGNQEELASEAPLAHFCPFGSQPRCSSARLTAAGPRYGLPVASDNRNQTRRQEVVGPRLAPDPPLAANPRPGNHGKQTALLAVMDLSHTLGFYLQRSTLGTRALDTG